MCLTHLMTVRVVEEVCPVGIGLHVSVHEELLEEESQDDEGDVVAGGLVQVHALVYGQALNHLRREYLLSAQLGNDPWNVDLIPVLKR